MIKYVYSSFTIHTSHFIMAGPSSSLEHIREMLAGFTISKIILFLIISFVLDDNSLQKIIKICRYQLICQA
jgi:hypothetical protein